VTVHRKHLNDDRTRGLVVAVVDEWVVLHELIDGPYLDDVVFLRLDHVTKVRRHSSEDYLTRAMAGLGEPLAEFECVSDATAGDLLRIVDARAELVCVYGETRKDYWLVLGKIHRIGRKRLDLHFIGRDGVWVDFLDAVKLKEITRIEYGGRYIQALERFGDAAPDAERRLKR